MSSRIGAHRRRRPSPGLVLGAAGVLIATAALVVALAGTATGLPGAFRIDRNDLRPRVVKPFNIQRNAVRPYQLAPNSVAGFHVRTNSIPNVDLRIGPRTRPVWWAVINNPAGAFNTSVARSSHPAITTSEGTYAEVQFPVNVSQCNWIATRGDPGTTVPFAGFAQTHGGDTPNEVRVATRDEAGTNEDDDFHLLVTC